MVVKGGAEVVAAGAVEAVEAGANRPGVEAGAVVVFATLNMLGEVEAAGAAVVAGLLNRDDCAGAEAGVDVVVDAEEAVGKIEAGFEAGAAVLAGVEPPSPLNMPPAAGAGVAVVLGADAGAVAAGLANMLAALPVEGVDSAGLEAAAPPKKEVAEVDGAPLVLAANSPPAGFGAVEEAEVLPKRLVPELLAVGWNKVLVFWAPPNKPPAGLGSV